MAHDSLSNTSLNAEWKSAYEERLGFHALWKFVMELGSRLHENRNLKGSLLVAAPDGFHVRKGVSMTGRHDIVAAIEDDIGVADLLQSIPMPLECEPLEFAQFLSKSYADRDADIPAEVFANGRDALKDFLRLVARKARPTTVRQ